MTPLEAIDWCNQFQDNLVKTPGIEVERFTLAVKATQTAKAALEKQIPKVPIGTYTDYKCPVCSRRVRSGKGSSCHQRDNFCQRCGQMLDW